MGLGYRREYQVEHRGEVSVRGGIVDVFPSTSDLPVRIDLWGDEVDRLTEFDPGDQRSLTELGSVALFGCREVLPTEDVRERARQLVGSAPWGRAQWERLAEGQLFDGMESWLPWLSDEDRVLPDLLGSGARVVLIDPRRMRDRAAELNDEEAALADALAVTWGVDEDQAGDDPAGDGEGGGGVFPRLHVAYERLLQKCPAPVLSIVAVASSSATPGITAQGWEPVHGDRARLAARLGELAENGYSVTVCAEGAGSADRLAAVLAEEGLSVPVLADFVRARPSTRPTCRDRGYGWWWLRSTGASWCPRPKWPSWPKPTSRAGAGPIGRPGPGPPGRRILRRPGSGGLRRAPAARGGPLQDHLPDGQRGRP